MFTKTSTRDLAECVSDERKLADAATSFAIRRASTYGGCVRGRTKGSERSWVYRPYGSRKPEGPKTPTTSVKTPTAFAMQGCRGENLR